MSFAKVTIVGRLGNDPESKHLQNGSLVVNFSMAADGRKKDTTTWFRVSAFGEIAERLKSMVERDFIKKGSLLYVEGQFEARQYTASDSTERTSNDVTMTDWRFVGSAEKPKEQRAQDFGNDYGSYGTDMLDDVPF